MMDIALSQEDRPLDVMAGQLRFLVDEAEERRRRKESYSELLEDLAPVTAQSLSSLSVLLAEAEIKGYVDFARGGMGVLDRVVTSFDEDDLESLGENIVLILETVKEMTQPEIMLMLSSTLHQVQEAEESGQPPSLLRLIWQMRTVEARRGLHRLVVALQSLGTVTPREHETRKEKPK